MVQVKDYTSGKILEDVKSAFSLLRFIRFPFIGYFIGKKLLGEIEKFAPKLINLKTAAKIINNSKKCAVGERVSRVTFKNSELTESVFLDELADGMVGAGKAKYFEKEDAINTLEKYHKNPLIILKVSGKYLEICRSLPKNCLY